MKISARPLSILLTFCLLTSRLSAQVSAQDSMALVDLYNSTNGPGWINHTNWLTTKPVTTWFGIGTSNNDSIHVNSVILPNNNLFGTIPASLGNLDGVIPTITLSNNRLSGSLPASLANLATGDLFVLQVDHNMLSGPIPSMGSPFVDQVFLDISYNNFTFADIEPILTSNSNGINTGLFTYNVEADLPLIQSGNILSIAAGGTISNNTYTWYKDGSIAATTTGDSTFTMTGQGTYAVSVTNKVIPSLTLYSIQNINTQDSLALVDLYNKDGGANWMKSSNWMTSVPAASWSGVTARFGRIQRLYLPNNNLSGSIPPSFVNLTGATYINFSYNGLNGSIPASIGNLSALNVLDLSYNQFTGAIPSVLGNLSALQYLYLSHNPLTGGIPASLGSLGQLNTLGLESDQLTGNIPPELGNLTKLAVLGLDSNQLTDTIPSSLGNMISISEIQLFSNQLTGHIPASFGRLTNLNELVLNSNHLTGTIPDSICNIPMLMLLWLQDNQLTGTLPDSIGKAQYLSLINVKNNNLSGTIPPLATPLYLADSLNISGNKYNFSIFPNAIPSSVNFTYAPQQNIPLTRTEDKLFVSAGGNSDHSTYTLFKDGASIATQTGDSSFTILGLGNYNIVTTNTDVPSLTLYSDTLRLGFVLPDSTVTTTQGISGDTTTNVESNIFLLTSLTPTAGAYALSGNVSILETVDTSIQTFDGAPYVQRHYDISPASNASTAQATITLYFTQADFDAYNAYVIAHNTGVPLLPTGGVDNGNVIITQYHGSFTGTSSPANYSQGADVIRPTLSWDSVDRWWTATFPVDGFSGFFLGSGSNPLPLTLLEFTGMPQGFDVNLQWKTTDEQNTKQFIVQRGQDGTTFDPIGTVAAINTSGQHQYGFIDKHPFTSNNFYRLKMQDVNDQFTYSPIVEVSIANLPVVFTAYPNPATSFTRLTFSSTSSSNFTIEISDVTGNILTRMAGMAAAGSNNFDIDLHGYAPGTYVITFSDVEHGRSSIRLLKE
jgi:Leucine-rich repeat (LRR) protein